MSFEDLASEYPSLQALFLGLRGWFLRAHEFVPTGSVGRGMKGTRVNNFWIQIRCAYAR